MYRRAPLSSVQLRLVVQQGNPKGTTVGATKVAEGLLLTHANAVLRLLKERFRTTRMRDDPVINQDTQLTTALASRLLDASYSSLITLSLRGQETDWEEALLADIVLPEINGARIDSDLVLLKVHRNVLDAREPSVMESLPLSPVALLPLSSDSGGESSSAGRTTPLDVVRTHFREKTCFGDKDWTPFIATYHSQLTPEELRDAASPFFLAPARRTDVTRLLATLPPSIVTPLTMSKREGYIRERLGSRLKDEDIGFGVFVYLTGNAYTVAAAVAVNAGPFKVPRDLLGAPEAEIRIDVTLANRHELTMPTTEADLATFLESREVVTLKPRWEDLRWW